MAVGHVRPHFFEIDVGFRFHLSTFWAAIADVRFWSRSSKLSSRSLRLGNKELLHTTQFQTALYTASGER